MTAASLQALSRSSLAMFVSIQRLMKRQSARWKPSSKENAGTRAAGSTSVGAGDAGGVSGGFATGAAGDSAANSVPHSWQYDAASSFDLPQYVQTDIGLLCQPILAAGFIKR